MKTARLIEIIREGKTPRSQWMRGVKEAALEELERWIQDEDRSQAPRSWEGFKRAWLNGADNFSQASWGGSWLIYNGDICYRYATYSENLRTGGGEHRPNSREEWLDVQARGEYQACLYAYKTMTTESSAF